MNLEKPGVDHIQISKSAFQGMKNLQLLVLLSENVRIHEGLSCLPNKLRLLKWKYYPLTFLPSKFSGKFLVELIMKESKLEKLWDGIKPLQRLKRMVLSDSWYLKEIPDLTNATRLEELDLNGCRSLLELTSTIGNATKLKRCILTCCFLLKELPSSMGKLINLEELVLRGCSGLKELSGCSSLEKLGGCSSLKKVDLAYTAIWEVPSSIRSSWSRLYRLDMAWCRNLKEFPNVPDSIETLLLYKTRIKKIPPSIENLSHLQTLMMFGCKKLKKISRNVSKLENLGLLDLRNSGEHYEASGAEGENPDIFKAEIEWEGPDSKGSCRFISDFEVDYILPRCLPDISKKALSLFLESYGLNTIPDCIRGLSGLIKLDVTKCRKLEALPRLPDSLLSIDAENCLYLERIDSSFQNPNICLNFAGCLSLNQNAKELIYTSDCKYALLPGEEVHAHFPHQATSGSLTINLTPRPLPSSLRFKACILLSTCDSLEKEEILMLGVSCNVIGKQNDLTMQYGSNQHHMPCKHLVDEDHVYIFEDSFCLNQDSPEAGEATLSELVFEFIVHGRNCKVKGCGVRLLFPHSIIDKNADDDDVDDDDDDDDESDDDDDDDDQSTLVPGVEIPAHFIYRATSDSLLINQPAGPFPLFLRFKACFLLSRGNINFEDLYDDDDLYDENLLMCVSCRFRGKQNDLTVPHESKERGMPYLYGCDDHLYTFEDSFCLDQDCPEAEDATYSELVFEFKVSYKNWKVKACGVQLLEDEEESGRDEDEDDEADDGDNDEVEEEIQDDVEKTQEGEEPRRDDEDGETRSTTSEVQPFCRYMKLSCCYIL
ncbi:unnamed protein product [Brassica napus]|uniref:(rape) hypothetical protein n=1 Tax=Brassica napus TaxID=3708 RepID=A0A816JGY3_BRANA|nr:unnamed protein product [Brassica napus]